jgi:hypothetical protein
MTDHRTSHCTGNGPGDAMLILHGLLVRHEFIATFLSRSLDDVREGFDFEHFSARGAVDLVMKMLLGIACVILSEQARRSQAPMACKPCQSIPTFRSITNQP